jgi:hypothetical protein
MGFVLWHVQVKRFGLHSHPVKAISFDDKAEYFASCCGDNYISVRALTAFRPPPPPPAAAAALQVHQAHRTDVSGCVGERLASGKHQQLQCCVSLLKRRP